jgi:hypothetical protein
MPFELLAGRLDVPEGTLRAWPAMISRMNYWGRVPRQYEILQSLLLSRSPRCPETCEYASLSARDANSWCVCVFGGQFPRGICTISSNNPLLAPPSLSAL